MGHSLESEQTRLGFVFSAIADSSYKFRGSTLIIKNRAVLESVLAS